VFLSLLWNHNLCVLRVRNLITRHADWAGHARSMELFPLFSYFLCRCRRDRFSTPCYPPFYGKLRSYLSLSFQPPVSSGRSPRLERPLKRASEALPIATTAFSPGFPFSEIPSLNNFFLVLCVPPFDFCDFPIPVTLWCAPLSY